MENVVRTRSEHNAGIIGHKFTTGSTSGYQRNWAYTFICLWGTEVKQMLNNTNGKGYEQEITCLTLAPTLTRQKL